MPQTIHEEAFRKQFEVNIMNGQEAVPDPLPKDWSTTRGKGLPVKNIPYLEYPRVMYLHPNEPYREIEHRNTRMEVVSVDVVPTEHLEKTVHSREEQEAAEADGWVTNPYIPKPPVDPVAHLYKKKQASKK